MEKYTKRQRLSIYKIALQVMREEIDNDCVGGTGFCFLLDVATMRYSVKAPKAPELEFDSFDNMVETKFPEITKHKPIDSWRGFWWDTRIDSGIAIRVKILEDTIAELSKK